MWLRVALAAATFAGVLCGSRAEEEIRRLTSEEERCEGQPGYGHGRYIAGKRAHNRSSATTLDEGWSTTEPLQVVKDCPFKYRLLPGDTITLIITRGEHHGTMGFEYEQEYQDGSTELPKIRMYFAWERFVSYYQPLYGEVGPDCYDDYVHTVGAVGSHTWNADTYAEDLTEVRTDFYHIENRTNGLEWSSSSRRRNGHYASTPTYSNQQHWGGDNGQLRMVLSALDLEQLTDKGEDTVFEGEMQWFEWGGTGDLLEDQYIALKQLYRDTCAPRRNGTAWNRPWDGGFYGINHLWMQNNIDDWDRMPYCTWLTGGWNDTYWDQHWNHSGGACHMIDLVRCDSEGYITALFLYEEGMKGPIDNTVGVMTGLERFSVSFNQLSGTVPAFFKTSQRLLQFDVWHNLFTGEVPCFTSPNLLTMDISYNFFSGTLPDCYADESQRNVNQIYLEHNYIRGTFPASWGVLGRMRYLWLKYNELSGTLPNEMCNLRGLWAMHLEGNRFSGTIPDQCLWTSAENGYPSPTAIGWVELEYLYASHNRFSGPLPRINPDGKEWLAKWLHLYEFDHNFFEGTIGDQWDALVAQSILSTFRFRDNRLSGPLPSRLENWTMVRYERVDYFFASNFFRCEPNGRWPEWVARRVDDDFAVSHLGNCLPIAHPTSVTPSSITEGEAASITVQGADFVSRGFQICRFIRMGDDASGWSIDAAALREQDTVITCQVPFDLTVGRYQVTVSNFQGDFASKELLDRLDRLPEIEVKAIEIAPGANAIEATMTLGGLSASSFTVQQEAFLGGVADHVGVPVAALTVLEENVPGYDGRRLQAAASVTPRLLVTLNETSNSIDNVRRIIKQLNDGESMKTAINAAFSRNSGYSSVSYVTVHRVGSTTAQTVPTASDSDDELPVVWIIVAVVTGLIACGLCGFIFFLYHMEKKGQAYFKEQLDDDGHVSESQAPPQRIGATSEKEESGLEV